MNMVLQYDVTELLVSHNDDGTMHVVFTLPECQASSSIVEGTLYKRDLHPLLQHRSLEERQHAVVSQKAVVLNDFVQHVERENRCFLQDVDTSGEQVFIEPLSAREQEVLEVLAQGASNQEIAQTLVIAPNTVKRHVQSILAKLGASNRTQAVTRALHLELLT